MTETENVLLLGRLGLVPVVHTICTAVTAVTTQGIASIKTFTSPITVPKLVPVIVRVSAPAGFPNLAERAVTVGELIDL